MQFRRAHASADQSLDVIDFVWCEFEFESGQILLHVLTIRCPRQRQRSDLQREPENNLARSALILCGEPVDHRV